MATCQQCNNKGDVLLKTGNSHYEKYLGWCKQCIRKDQYELSQQGIAEIKGFFNKVFG